MNKIWWCLLVLFPSDVSLCECVAAVYMMCTPHYRSEHHSCSILSYLTQSGYIIREEHTSGGNTMYIDLQPVASGCHICLFLTLCTHLDYYKLEH